jgi:hypothetical protein
MRDFIVLDRVPKEPRFTPSALIGAQAAQQLISQILHEQT